MKGNYSLVIKIVLLLLLSLGTGYVFIRGYYFSSALLLLGVVAVGISIFTAQQRFTRKVRNIAERIEYGDMNVVFPEELKGPEGELNRFMNQAFLAYRTRLYNAIASEMEMEAWQKLIRVLAHEMMNSLTPIISLSETMSEREMPEEPDRDEYQAMLEAMQSIHRRSTGLLHFVENYRKLTRIPEPMPQFFQIDELFDDLRRLMGNEIARISFNVHPPELRLYADRVQIEQVVLNLLKNALEAVGDKTKLRISVDAGEKESKTWIRVADNGPGILPESLDKIFVPFYTTKQSGAGIGLSLSRQIMSRHNGSITVESPEAGGTTFILRFN